MDTNTFKEQAFNPSWSIQLQALWHEGNGDWQAAHDLVDALSDSHSSWIHAYLHRQEGDEWNANYWYRRAGRSMPKHSMNEEWEELVEYFLKK